MYVADRIEAVIGEKVGEESFGQVLKNGQILVKLINKIKEGSVKKMETSGMAFKQMENISNFLRACRVLGVEEYEVFETVDLFEAKDLNVVVDCLYALSRTVQKKLPSFRGPFIGTSSTTTTTPPPVSVFECAQATQAMSLNTGSTSESSVTTKPSSSPPKPSAPPSKPVKTVLSSSVAQSSAPVNSSGSAVAVGSRGAGYGLDAALAKKEVLVLCVCVCVCVLPS
jgi:hypothetical protein